MHIQEKNIIKLLPRTFGAKVFLFACLATALLFSGCNKSTVVGLDVQPEGDLLHNAFSDTMGLKTYIVREDSVRSDETLINLLGSYNDPVFGKTTASVFTQFNTNTVTFGNPSDLEIDSAVLSLVYTGDYYGTLEAQKIKVYQLTQSLFRDSLYYSNRMLAYNPVEIGNLSAVPKPTDSVKIGGTTLKPQLRIRLTPAFGQGFLDQGGFADNTAFLNYFKGLFVTCDNAHAPGQGAILSLNLLDAQTKITLYYRNKFGNKGDQSNFSFGITGTTARYGHFTHDDAVNDITQQLSDPSLGQNLVYVQPMAGVMTKIDMPTLKNYLDSGAIAVNKAELILKVEPASTALYGAPASLALLGADASGNTVTLIDQGEGDTYFGGTYNGTSKEYRFNLARHIQRVLTGKQADYGLYIAAGRKNTETSAVSAKRVVLGGGSNTLYRMQLRITYTKLY